MEVINHISGMSTELKTSVEKLIRDSERLTTVKAYLKTTDYPDKNTLLALTGEETKKEI